MWFLSISFVGNEQCASVALILHRDEALAASGGVAIARCAVFKSDHSVRAVCSFECG